MKDAECNRKFILTPEIQDKIKNYINQTQYNFWNNMTYYQDGYSLNSLGKILPADVPVILVGGQVSYDEITILKKIRSFSCVLAEDASLTTLTEAGILPDFILMTSGIEENISKKVEKIPVITGLYADSQSLKRHLGPKFLMWDGNRLEQMMWETAWKSSARVYRYNTLEVVTGNSFEKALNIAELLGASQVIVFGDTFNSEEPQDEMNGTVLYERNLSEKQISKVIENGKYVVIDLPAILAEIIPFYDEEGRMAFKNEMVKMKDRMDMVDVDISSSIQLYTRLYEVAMQGTAEAKEIDGIVGALNENTERMEQNIYAKYILNILEGMNEELSTQYVSEKERNEIAAVSMDGICTFEKLYFINESIKKIYEQMMTEVLHRKNYVPPKLKHVPSILFLYGSSQYNVLPYFAKGLKEGFQKLKYHSYIDAPEIKQISKDGYSHYQNTKGFDYVVMMNGVYEDVQFMDITCNHFRNVFDHVGTQIIEFFVDHPIRHIGFADRLVYQRGYAKTVWGDNNWKKYMETYMPQIKYSYFLPLGGIEQKDDCEFYEKENKVVFFGSYTDLDEFENYINQYMDASLTLAIIKRLIADPSLTIEQAMKKIGKENDCEYSMERKMLQLKVFGLVDTYIRAYYRQQVIITLAKAGIPLELYGWKGKQLEDYENVEIKDSVSIEKMLEICRHRRFVLNVNPWLKDGTQERVFNTMLGKSVCITDENNYLLQQCHHGENVIFYQLDKIEKLPDQIRYYMEHESEAAAIAQEGYILAKKEHTWTKRAEQLADLLDMPKNL